MKYALFILTFLLSGCGHLEFGKDRVVYRAFNNKLSCLGLRCCYPYGEKLMVCNQGAANGDGIFIRYNYEQK